MTLFSLLCGLVVDHSVTGSAGEISAFNSRSFCTMNEANIHNASGDYILSGVFQADKGDETV